MPPNDPVLSMIGFTLVASTATMDSTIRAATTNKRVILMVTLDGAHSTHTLERKVRENLYLSLSVVYTCDWCDVLVVFPCGSSAQLFGRSMRRSLTVCESRTKRERDNDSTCTGAETSVSRRVAPWLVETDMGEKDQHLFVVCLAHCMGMFLTCRSPNGNSKQGRWYKAAAGTMRRRRGKGTDTPVLTRYHILDAK